MLRFKTEIRLHPHVAIALLLQVATEVFESFGYDAWITSANDGAHKEGSLHYQDAALDFRLKHVPQELRAEVTKALRKRLAPQFDVLHEYVGTEHEHVHVEYDPGHTNG